MMNVQNEQVSALRNDSKMSLPDKKKLKMFVKVVHLDQFSGYDYCALNLGPCYGITEEEIGIMDLHPV